MEKWDSIWVNARLVTCRNGLDIISKGALAIQQDKIAWLGPMDQLTDSPSQLAKQVYDVNNKWILPGFIDCHTHLVYAGQRSTDIAKRLQGQSYQSIAQEGGGIMSTVRATRQATEEELFVSASKRIQARIKEGMTRVEIKSGYGLDLENEIKMLKVANKLSQFYPISISKTFLGLHTLPSEFSHDRKKYLQLMCEQALPAAHAMGLVDAVDIFCESIAFSKEEAEYLFKIAKKLNLAIKIHAEQLSTLDSVALACQYQALSCDHLEYISEKSIEAMKMSQAIAVLLPYAFYFLRETRKPPVELLRHNKILMALATDTNPGTSPINSLRMILNMACILYGFSVEEAFLGVTKYAAQALGLKEEGELASNKKANFVVLNCQELSEWIFSLDNDYVSKVIYQGNISYQEGEHD